MTNLFSHDETDQPNPTRSIRQGLIQGARPGNVDSFLGVPYAEPAIGPLRFRAPVRHAPGKDCGRQPNGAFSEASSRG